MTTPTVSEFYSFASAQPFGAAGLITFLFSTEDGRPEVAFSVTPETAAKIAVQVSSAILKLEDGASAL